MDIDFIIRKVPLRQIKAQFIAGYQLPGSPGPLSIVEL